MFLRCLGVKLVESKFHPLGEKTAAGANPRGRGRRSAQPVAEESGDGSVAADDVASPPQSEWR